MSVSRKVELRNVLIEAGTLQIKSFIEANTPVRRRRAAPYDLGATVRDTAVGAWRRGSRRTCASVGAKPGCRTTLGS